MNGLLQETYSTIHVTPQPQCSYVSYETNYQAKDYNMIVDNVLKTFKPGKFIVTLFANKVSQSLAAFPEMFWCNESALEV